MQNGIHSIFKTFFLLLVMGTPVYAQSTASILPPAETTFLDNNGKPLSSGTVDFYIPSTTTRKTTWQDIAETVPNTNPVVLDAAGRAIVLGSGNYRQVVKDKNGNLQWDQITSSTGAGGNPGGPCIGLGLVTVGTGTVVQCSSVLGSVLQIGGPTEFTAANSTVGIHLVPPTGPSGTGGAFVVESNLPTFILVDQQGNNGTGGTPNTASHGSYISTAAYDSAGVYHDGAFKFNPGWSYSDAQHMQSDLDMTGWLDGKGIIGLLAYSGGSTASNAAAAGAITNAAFIPVPSANFKNVDSLNASATVVMSIVGAANNGSGKVRLTVPSTSFTGTGTGTVIAATAVSGFIYVQSGITGTGVPADTYIIKQLTGPTGGAGTYLTNNAITSAGATITADNTREFTTGMFCWVESVLGTVEANGKHTCTNVGDKLHLDLEQTFTNAYSSSGFVSVMNPTDLGSGGPSVAAHEWNDFYLGGNIYQGFGVNTNPSQVGYSVIAQNSCAASWCSGDMIRHFINNNEYYRISTTINGISNISFPASTGFSWTTNVSGGSPGLMALSAAGGLSVGDFVDPGAGAISIKNATYLIRNHTSFTSNGAAATTTLGTAGPTGKTTPTKWIALDDNGTTRYIPTW